MSGAGRYTIRYSEWARHRDHTFLRRFIRRTLQRSMATLGYTGPLTFSITPDPELKTLVFRARARY